MYKDFAFTYDSLTEDVDYKKRTEYILSLFEKYDRKPTLMLDLCCGTGSFAIEFSKRNIQVIGNDISEDMLSVAREKTQKENLDVLYLCQTAEELDLYGTVDGAVCLMDSLNHITDYTAFCKALSNVSLFLEKDRLFIFDVNTLYKAEKILGNNTFVSEEENIYLVWQNSFDKDSNTNEILLDFFIQNEDGTYERTSEDIIERAYTNEEIMNALKTAGLKAEAVFDDLTENKPTKTSERIFYVARKI